MPGRVEADAHVVLGLELGERRALGDGVDDARLQIVDLDLQCIIICWSPGPAGQTGRT